MSNVFTLLRILHIGSELYILITSQVEEAETEFAYLAALENPVIETIMSMGGLHHTSLTTLEKKDVAVQMLVEAVSSSHLEPCFAQ